MNFQNYKTNYSRMKKDMNHFEIGLLVWAIFTTLASVYELFIIICNDMDSDVIQVKDKRIAELNKKLTKIKSQNLELEI